MARRPRKLRADAVLKKLEDPAQRKQIAEWLEVDGWQSCAQRIASELGITFKGKPVSGSMIYEALAYWEAQGAFSKFDQMAGALAVSKSLKPRPCTIGMSSASKYPRLAVW